MIMMIIVGFIMLLMGMNYKSHNLPMIKLPIFGAECCGTDRSSFWKTLVAALARFSCSPQWILFAMAKLAVLIGHLSFWCLDSLDKVTDDRQLVTRGSMTQLDLHSTDGYRLMPKLTKF